MPAYIIADIEVKDPQTYQEYIKVVPATIAQYGGTYVARGGKTEALEGNWKPQRLVILKFDSFERAKEWYTSAAYSGPRSLRQAASEGRLLLVDGYEGA